MKFDSKIVELVEAALALTWLTCLSVCPSVHLLCHPDSSPRHPNGHLTFWWGPAASMATTTSDYKPWGGSNISHLLPRHPLKTQHTPARPPASRDVSQGEIPVSFSFLGALLLLLLHRGGAVGGRPGGAKGCQGLHGPLTPSGPSRPVPSPGSRPGGLRAEPQPSVRGGRQHGGASLGLLTGPHTSILYPFPPLVQ